MSWGHANRVQSMKSTRSMSYILLLSRPVLSRPLSSETLVWLLSVVAYSDSSTTSQAEVPLEQIHAFYWEMGPFTYLLLNAFIISHVNFFYQFDDIFYRAFRKLRLQNQ